MEKVAFASDHAGYELKGVLEAYMREKGYEIVDFGTYSSESCDYPDYAHPCARAVESGECDFGIAMCGSGNGIAMTLNKHQQIRAAICWQPELATLAKQHNNANILVFGGRTMKADDVIRRIELFLNENFEGGRHQKRLDKIEQTE